MDIHDCNGRLTRALAAVKNDTNVSAANKDLNPEDNRNRYYKITDKGKEFLKGLL